MSALRIDVVTIFPELFPGPLGASIPGRALERGLAQLHAHDLRQWGLGRHRSVDDYPYGGGAGMIMRVEPIAGALGALSGPQTTRILFDPGGVVFNQALAHDLAAREHLLGDLLSPPLIGKIADVTHSLRTGMWILPIAIAIAAAVWISGVRAQIARAT